MISNLPLPLPTYFQTQRPSPITNPSSPLTLFSPINLQSKTTLKHTFTLFPNSLIHLQSRYEFLPTLKSQSIQSNPNILVKSGQHPSTSALPPPFFPFRPCCYPHYIEQDSAALEFEGPFLFFLCSLVFGCGVIGMGNASGREEGGSDTQSVVEDAAAAAAAQVSMADQDGGQGPEYMGGQSPPSSPRASQSPLMFRPQMPVVPLQRPDELNIPSPSWMQTSSGYEDVYNEQGIPTMITWSYGGKEVSVEGSWDSWKSRKPLQRSGKDFTIMKVLPSGVYQYRFLVDGQWRHSPDLPWEQDDSGNAYNVLDLQDYVPEDIDSISGFEPPQSPDSSYNNTQLGQEDFGKEPPMVPPHLNSTLLNAPSPQMEIPPPYSRPQHVVLNHLYMHRDRSRPSVVALGSTNRFLSKYVTVVLYKSIQR